MSDARRGSQEVEVARINARQAITVALVTAAVTLGATWISQRGAASTPSDNRPAVAAAATPAAKPLWLMIHGVEGEAEADVRISMRVDGIGYAYPYDSAFTRIGLTMAKQRIPLIAGPSVHLVTFEVTTATGDRYISRDEVRIDPANPPEGTATFTLSKTVGGTKLSNVNVRVVYAISRN